MAKKNKLWFSGEDAQLTARFTKCLTKALYNRRTSYLRAKAEQAAKLGVEKNTVSTHRRNACEKIRKEMEEN